MHRKIINDYLVVRSFFSSLHVLVCLQTRRISRADKFNFIKIKQARMLKESK